MSSTPATPKGKGGKSLNRGSRVFRTFLSDSLRQTLIIVALGILANASILPAQTILDHLVLYTPQAKEQAGSDQAIRALINQAVREGNEALSNSQIDARLRLVHIAPASEDESGSTSGDLDRLEEPTDGFYDIAHALRDEVGADLVSLILDGPNSSGVGRANQYSAFSKFSSKPFEQIAYSVVLRRSLVGTYTLIHELGHNLGAHHTRGDQGSGGIFEYSNAYRFSTEGQTFRTLMGRQFGTKIPYFSNPLVQFRGEATGSPADSEDSADNARTINETAPDIAAYRPKKIFNDALADAIPIEGFWASATGTNIGATAEPDEPNHAGQPAQHSVWWRWTSPVSESIEISTEGTTMPHRLALYERDRSGKLVSLKEQADRTPPLRIDVRQGQELLLAVDGIDGSQGYIALQLSKNNDDFANRIRLNTAEITTTALNRNATTEPREPAHGNFNFPFFGVSDSLWWEWEAPTDGTTTLSTQGTSFETVLGVYQGDELTELQLVAEENFTGSNGPWRLVQFEAQAGERYQIAIGSARSLDSRTGLSVLNLSLARSIGVRFAGVLPQADGSIRLTLNGFVERPFIIESSNDLQSWSSIGDPHGPELPLTVSIPDALDAPAQFFRIRLSD